MAVSFDRLNSAVLTSFAKTVTFGAETFEAIDETDFVDDYDTQGYDRYISADTAIIAALSLTETSAISMESVAYTILTMEADDEGMTKMKLEKA